ncbi:MAG: M12 family metallo-peptidase [Mobilicoccus sp.]|nr:M12 family metallo-peptidase [Mobilicoccus sp.]
MRGLRRVAAAATVAMVLAAETVALAATHDTSEAAVTVSGVIERLSDRDAEHGTALRLPDGKRLPIDDPGEARTGDVVSVTMPVPDKVTEAVSRGESVEGDDGALTVTRGELRAAARTPAQEDSSLAEASVHAALHGAEVAHVEGVRVVSHAQNAPAAGVSEVHVAIAVPRGVSASAPTAEQVRTQVSNVAAYWREQSGGQVNLRLAGTTRPYRSAYTCRDNPFDLWTEAARAAGFTEGARKHLVIVMPRAATEAGCSYGLASMGQSVGSGGIVYVADTAWPVLAHEIGHNFGLAHAKTLRCGSASDANLRSLPRGCRVEDYGDPYDIMAASSRDNAGSLSTPQAARLGFLGARDVMNVTTPTARVQLTPVSSRRGVRAARIRDPRSGEVYWVEYRTRTGRDARLYQPMTAGIRVLREERVTEDNPWPGTIALDATPTGQASDWSWHLPVGHRLTSVSGGVTVSVERADANSATVFINAGQAQVAGTRVGQVTRFGRTAAAAATPRPTMRALSINAGGTASWSSTGGARYDVVIRRVNGGGRTGPIQTWYANTTRTSARLSMPRGTTVQVRARARSASGAVSDWSGWRTVTFR